MTNLTFEDIINKVQHKGYNIVASVRVPTVGPKTYEILATKLDRSFRLWGTLQDLETQLRQKEIE